MFALGAEAAYHGLNEGNLPTTTSYGQVLVRAGVLASDDLRPSCDGRVTASTSA